MPRDTKTMPICAPDKNECIEESIEHVETSVFDTSSSVGAECACLPACTEMKFPFSITQGNLVSSKYIKFNEKIKKTYPKLADDEFVQENVAILHIYHEHLHFLKHERGEVSLMDNI